MLGEEEFLAVTRLFLQREMDANTFCDKFTKIWIAYRDTRLAKQDEWTERYDLKLTRALKEGEITLEEFDTQWRDLWGYADIEPLIDMVDRIHSSCAVFYEFPEEDFEIDENQLRFEVANELAAYTAQKQTSE